MPENLMTDRWDRWLVSFSMIGLLSFFACTAKEEDKAASSSAAEATPPAVSALPEVRYYVIAEA